MSFIEPVEGLAQMKGRSDLKRSGLKVYLLPHRSELQEGLPTSNDLINKQKSLTGIPGHLDCS